MLFNPVAYRPLLPSWNIKRFGQLLMFYAAKYNRNALRSCGAVRACTCVCDTNRTLHYRQLIVYLHDRSRSIRRSFCWKFSDTVMKFRIRHTACTFLRPAIYYWRLLFSSFIALSHVFESLTLDVELKTDNSIINY